MNKWCRQAKIIARRSARRVRVIDDDDAEPIQAPHGSDESDDEYYDVEEILKERRVNGQRQLLLRWKGWPQPSWEPVEHLDRCPELLQFFNENYD